jgi:phenylalanyl-tRNA synthetase beta subunit
MPQEDWEGISGLVAQIIFDDKGLKKSDFIKEYKQSGIFSDASLNVFNRLIGDDYTKGDIEDILKATEKGIEDIKHVLDLYDNGDLVLKAAHAESMRKLIKEEQDIIKKIKAKL